MYLNKFHQNILNDVRIELDDEFDRNFERKAFFDKPWVKTVLMNRRGSLMARNNNLRRSLQSKVDGDKIRYSSSLPYASIHNEGGEIKVTAKMKKYFWAKYYEAGGSKSKNIEASQFKALALMPIGKKMKIPERRFIGQHPRIREVIQEVVNDNLDDLNKIILNQLKQK